MKDLIRTRGGRFAKNERITGLDVLRVAMALLIFMFHSNMHFGCYYSVLDPFVSVGAIAMTGFFALSGYSLRLVYGERNLIEIKELGKFYLKRMLGVLPLYYMLALIYVLFLGKETIGQNLILLPIELLGLQSTFCSLFTVTHNGGTWFISCLLIGYIIYPFLQTVVKQLSTRQKVRVILILIFVDLWAAVVRNQYNLATIYDNPFYRVTEFTIGLIVADLNIKEDGKLMEVLRSWGMLLVSIIMLVGGITLAKYYGRISDYMLLNWIALPCFVIMLFPLGSLRMPYLDRSKLLNYASQISYAFFLSQYFAWNSGRWFVEAIGYDANWVRILFTFTFCVAISVLMYEIVQKGFVGWFKKKYSL